MASRGDEPGDAVPWPVVHQFLLRFRAGARLVVRRRLERIARAVTANAAASGRAAVARRPARAAADVAAAVAADATAAGAA